MSGFLICSLSVMAKELYLSKNKSDLQVCLILVNIFINNLLEYTQRPFFLC